MICLSTMPCSIVSSPATFSPTIHRGLNSRITLSISGQRKRLSLVPFLRPAWLNGWQGNPPVRRSTLPRGSAAASCDRPGRTGTCFPSSRPRAASAVSVRMSPKIGAPGQCCSRTFWQKVSLSQNRCCTFPFPHTRSAASAAPPMPENRSMCVIFMRLYSR